MVELVDDDVPALACRGAPPPGGCAQAQNRHRAGPRPVARTTRPAVLPAARVASRAASASCWIGCGSGGGRGQHPPRAAAVAPCAGCTRPPNPGQCGADRAGAAHAGLGDAELIPGEHAHAAAAVEHVPQVFLDQANAGSHGEGSCYIDDAGRSSRSMRCGRSGATLPSRTNAGPSGAGSARKRSGPRQVYRWRRATLMWQ